MSLIEKVIWIRGGGGREGGEGEIGGGIMDLMVGALRLWSRSMDLVMNRVRRRNDLERQDASFCFMCRL